MGGLGAKELLCFECYANEKFNWKKDKRKNAYYRFFSRLQGAAGGLWVLTVDGLDKPACYRRLLEVDARYEDLGVCDVCGKCATGPCAVMPGDL